MVKIEPQIQVDVSLPGYHYPIIISPHAVTDAGHFQSFIRAPQVLIVTNETVAPLYLPALQESFKDIQCDVVILPDGEEYKNVNSLHMIYDELIKNRHHRDTTLIALGGGVVGDITGFAASTYQRGVSYIQIPTTLLAQIDASVGGKTAINHELGKNMIGSFYQPKAVIIDPNTLLTLSEREFCSGLGEMIKYALLEGGLFLDQLKNSLDLGLTAKSAELSELIAECCRIKTLYVQADEKEEGCRALLNLGHTFGHAIETYSHYKEWLHGEAVAIGLFCAALLSEKLGLIDYKMVEDVESLLKQAKLPHKIPKDYDLESLLELMSLDKKIRANSWRFVVIRTFGDCYLDNDITKDIVYETLCAAI